MISPKPAKLKFKRPRKPQSMTIATAFTYQGGMLFCADTMVTGASRLNQSKIVHHVSSDGLCSFTFASSAIDLNFPLSAISKCWEAVRDMDFSVRSLEEVHHAAEFSLADFYSTHIYPHPDRQPESPYLQMLVGINLRGECGLYLSNETVLNAVEQYECIGAGAYLAKYLIGKYCKANQRVNSFQDAALIARYAVQSAIDYDGRCGGIPEFVVINTQGTVDRKSNGLYFPNGDFVEGLFDLNWKLLHRIAIAGDTQIDSDQQIDEFAKKAKELDLHQRWRDF
jgi:hypothetical protein